MTDNAMVRKTYEDGTRRVRPELFLPIAFFALLTAVFAWGLTMDPRSVPSNLIEKPVPEFSLPPVKDRTLGLSNTDFLGDVSLVNVFASWCAACLQEHPLFMQLKQDATVPIHGLNYKDPPDSANRWLNRHGDPYTRTGADRDGRVGIDWGVYGVPETFVIGKDGRVHYKHIGPVTQEVLQTKLLPMIERLQRK